MTQDTFRQAKIIQEDIQKLKSTIQRIKDTIPQLISGDKIILTYGELQEMGIMESIIKQLKEKITELEERFERL